MKNLKEYLSDVAIFLFVAAIIAVVVFLVVEYNNVSKTADTDCLIRCKASVDFLCVWRCQP